VAVEASQTVLLTDLTTCGGCAAKWGASLLRELVPGMASDRDGLLVGLNRDAARALRAQAAAVHAVTDVTGFGLRAAVDPAAVGALAAAGFVPVGQVTAGAPGVSLR